MAIKGTVLGLVCVLLVGCGHMGPLYLPKHDQGSDHKTHNKSVKHRS